MPKRMVDTELWNDEEIVENFTAEDRYFWLYLLTSPHNNICGVMKHSPVVIARDMGYHKDCIVNLIYRFETVHNLIYVDKDTKEIFILNWYKHNWTKSPKIISLVDKERQKVKSETIKAMIEERKAEIYGIDTVSIGYGYPPNTIPNPNTISKSIKESSISMDDEDFPEWVVG